MKHKLLEWLWFDDEHGMELVLGERWSRPSEKELA